MEYRKIISDIKLKNFSSIYFLSGLEPYFIDKITNTIEKAILNEDEKSFDQHIFYGNETDVQRIIETAKRFPMISKQQLVIIKEAQNIKKIENLISYVENPQSSTILVLCYKNKKVDKRKKLYTLLKKKFIFFESRLLYENEIADWIEKLIKKNNFSITPNTVAILCDYLGNDLTKIEKEIEKLKISLPKETVITPSVIEKYIGISKEYNNFELQFSIGNKDNLKAQKIIRHFSANPNLNPLPLTLSILYVFFSKLMLYHSLSDKSKVSSARALKINPFFVKDYALSSKNYSFKECVNAISYLKECDLHSKGIGVSNVPHEELLKEAVFKIMH